MFTAQIGPKEGKVTPVFVKWSKEFVERGYVLRAKKVGGLFFYLCVFDLYKWRNGAIVTGLFRQMGAPDKNGKFSVRLIWDFQFEDSEYVVADRDEVIARAKASGIEAFELAVGERLPVYSPIYRCRKCGAEFTDDAVRYTTPVTAFIDLCDKKLPRIQFGLHRCKDEAHTRFDGLHFQMGAVSGMADLIGFEATATERVKKVKVEKGRKRGTRKNH